MDTDIDVGADVVGTDIDVETDTFHRGVPWGFRGVPWGFQGGSARVPGGFRIVAQIQDACVFLSFLGTLKGVPHAKNDFCGTPFSGRAASF